MKKAKALFCAICALVLIYSLCFFPVYAADESQSAGQYVYTINVKVDNPCNSNDMDKDAVNVLFFEYHYNGKNGYDSEKTEKFDMSWNGSSNQNSDFLNEHFIRSNDNSCYTSFDVTLPGKLNRMFIKLNMDGGERLSFTIESIYCNDKRINSNTDYVSSAYNDSTANIYCSMEESMIDQANSPYFEANDDFLTEKEMESITKNATGSEYTGQFKDQYNAVIDLSVLQKCVGVSDGDINQYYAHNDEESMYKYTFNCQVDNPINLRDADYDEVEVFYLEISYIDQNGYGSNKTYKLDMAYSDSLKRNLNQKYLERFQRYDDDGYQTSFSVWVPGIITKVDVKLNMSGEKLVVYFDKIMLNSVAVNTTRDYVSSTYYNSKATIKCSVPQSQIALGDGILPSTYTTDFADQYGAIVSEKLFDNAKENQRRYIYHK